MSTLQPAQTEPTQHPRHPSQIGALATSQQMMQRYFSSIIRRRMIELRPLHIAPDVGQGCRMGTRCCCAGVKLLKEEGRSEIIDAKSVIKLLAVAKQPLHDVAVIVLDCGLRPSELFEMRWEDIACDTEMIFIPRGKTKQSRRLLPMSKRVHQALQSRWDGQASGWVFPADSQCGHTTTVAKAFRNAREGAGLSKDIVLYSGRHSFGTKLLASTGNLSLAMRAMGHSSVQSAMVYQHPDLETVRSVMNGNTTEVALRHNSRHKAAA